MAKIKQRGKAGAAKAYMTRSSAIKKLQCSLADFRRLCILKGIFPREPRSRKKANKGSSAPTSFYYAKDIAYLAHEPVLKKLREHKTFAKKLSRALGRGEWSNAKSLEDNKPVYRLDHIIKERYPTFIDAVRDIDDALCLVSLFASLPSNHRLPPSLIENCARLSSEWQLYIMHTHALRKAFLSIKGVYFQAEVLDQTVTWLVPYQFTQNIPTDVDVRVMLTFLELYQTLLGFVFFKLYTDAGLSYPPPLDADKDAAGAGVGAYSLREAVQQPIANGKGGNDVMVEGRKISVKDVRQTIKSISLDASANTPGDDLPMATEDVLNAEVDDDFVQHPSKTNPEESASLTTLKEISSLPEAPSAKLFSSYTFFLSRETSRPLFEFLIRSFGGRVGWPASSGSGSPIDESDDSVTHVVIDRPLGDGSVLTEEEKHKRRIRKYVQPQWIVDCINGRKLLQEDGYAQGKTLPPHLSPFGEERGAYDPVQDGEAAALEEDGASESASESEDAMAADDENAGDSAELNVFVSAADHEQLRAAELEAEARGVDFGTFDEQVSKAKRRAKKAEKKAQESVNADVDTEADMNKMMMSQKQRKLYDKMKFGEKKQATERARLQHKKQQLVKDKKRTQRS